MFINLYNNHIKVFIADAPDDKAVIREKLCKILSKSGMDIIECQGGESESQIMETVSQADCSVHILGNVDIYNPEGAGYNTPAGIQYRTARELRGEKFKMFIWNPDGIVNQYVNNIRRDIAENTLYSSHRSPIVFVEELRGIMNMRKQAADDVQQKDIFFIYNDLDKDTAIDIANMLQDVQSVARLNITMNNDTDYTQYIKNQLPGCKIGVIYYNYASDWALSFARQVWKDTGGSSSPAPWFIIGNSDHANPDALKIFDGIIAHSVREKSLIPLDIKIFYDKTIENKSTE
ncbi:MAG: hypothetical protein IKR94_07340 [Bacteroidales bacterium]|nr:hypothetical protein [Bacteroidales bacterium]